MNDDENNALTALYATWDTEKLTDAVTNRRLDYTPEARELIAHELTARGVSWQAANPDNGQQTGRGPIFGFIMGATIGVIVYFAFVAWMASGLGLWPSSPGAILVTGGEGLLFIVVGGAIGACGRPRAKVDGRQTSKPKPK